MGARHSKGTPPISNARPGLPPENSTTFSRGPATRPTFKRSPDGKFSSGGKPQRQGGKVERGSSAGERGLDPGKATGKPSSVGGPAGAPGVGRKASNLRYAPARPVSSDPKAGHRPAMAPKGH